MGGSGEPQEACPGRATGASSCCGCDFDFRFGFTRRLRNAAQFRACQHSAEIAGDLQHIRMVLTADPFHSGRTTLWIWGQHVYYSSSLVSSIKGKMQSIPFSSPRRSVSSSPLKMMNEDYTEVELRNLGTFQNILDNPILNGSYKGTGISAPVSMQLPRIAA